MNCLELAIDSDLSQVSLVAVAVNRVCLYLGLNERMAGEIELCVVEALTNAIRHAYKSAPGNRVAVTIEADRSQLSIDVCDSGIAMPGDDQRKLLDVSTAPELHLEDRHSIPEGGRGLQIIRALMTEVSYTSKERLNRLTMKKKYLGSS